jgi:hypothetical protein
MHNLRLHSLIALKPARRGAIRGRRFIIIGAPTHRIAPDAPGLEPNRHLEANRPHDLLAQITWGFRASLPGKEGEESMLRQSKDPIFAAIEKHRSTYSELGVAGVASDDFWHQHKRHDRKLERQLSRSCNANVRAARQFARTRPTTTAGAIAAMRFVAESVAEGDYLLDVRSGDRTGRPCGPVFLATMSEALKRLAV